MSPHVGNFVADLVEMAKATEELPKVQHELEQAKRELDHAQQTVQHRELRIIDLNNEIDALKTKLRETEAQRDDAELKFLEAQEQRTKFTDMVKTAATALGLTISEAKAEVEKIAEAASPTETAEAMPAQSQGWAEREAHPTSEQPTPVQEPSQAVGQAEGQREPLPTAAWPTSDTTAGTTSAESSASANSQPDTGPFGTSSSPSVAKAPEVAQPHPTPAPAQEPVIGTTATSQAGATSADDERPKPYLGKRYYDVPVFVSLSQWLAGGGTEEDYNWRPAAIARG